MGSRPSTTCSSGSPATAWRRPDAGRRRALAPGGDPLRAPAKPAAGRAGAAARLLAAARGRALALLPAAGCAGRRELSPLSLPWDPRTRPALHGDLRHYLDGRGPPLGLPPGRARGPRLPPRDRGRATLRRDR